MAIASRCLEATFSLTREEEAERIEGYRCSNILGGCWTDRTMNDQRSYVTSGKRSRCGGGSGIFYGGRGQSRLSWIIFSAH